MKKESKIYLGVLASLVLFAVTLLGILNNRISEKNDDYTMYTSTAVMADVVEIMSFNIQIFGVSKSNKTEVMEIIADLVSGYDIVAIQEIRDSTDTAINTLMDLLPENYEYIQGERDGRSKSKEQYAFVYDSEVVNVLSYMDYEDIDDKLERSPFMAHFKLTDGTDFVMINTHLKPKDVYNELVAMKDVERAAVDAFREKDVVILGDFNSDGTYFDEEKLTEFYPVSDYTIVTGNEIDTTVNYKERTYDRIIITDDMNNEYTGYSDVLVFDDYYDFTTMNIEPKHVSDHYPITMELYLGVDND